MTDHRKISSGFWPLLLALALLAPPSAFAAPPRADPVMTSAMAHADNGARLYRSGDFAGALNEYESARRLRASTAFDVGVARCFERLGRTDEAMVLYKQVLESLDSQPAHANEARERLRVLKARVASEAVAPAATAKPTAPAAAKPAGAAATAKQAGPSAPKPAGAAATAKQAGPAAPKPAGTAAPHEPEPRPATAANTPRQPGRTATAKGSAREPASHVAPAASEPAPEPAPTDDEASEPDPEPAPPSEAAGGRLAWLLEPRRSLFIGIGVGAGAAVFIATGLALYLSADSDYLQLFHTCAPSCNPAEVDGPRAKEIVGDLLLGVGLVAAAADAALWIYRGLVRREQSAWILPAGAGFVAGGRF